MRWRLYQISLMQGRKELRNKKSRLDINESNGSEYYLADCSFFLVFSVSHSDICTCSFYHAEHDEILNFEVVRI